MNDYQNSDLTPKQRADDLLSRMSLEEKMGQVTCYFPQQFKDHPALKKTYPHGVGQVSSLEMRNLSSLREAAEAQRDLQRQVMELSEHHIPAIFHMEGLCGAYIPGATSFPSGISRGASWDPELETKIGQIVSRQERALGITQTFAPVLDVTRDARLGRQGESYGEDPTLAASLGSAFAKGLQETQAGPRQTDAVAKHFLGADAVLGGIHGANVELSNRELREIYAKPFQAAITEADLHGIMPCYCSLNGEPVSASKTIINDLLRDEMGFTGLTVSDYCAIENIHKVQKVCETLTEAGLRAMEAGLDQELHFKSAYGDELQEWFRDGSANVAILDRAVHRALEAKFRMGLFENPFAYIDEALDGEFFAETDHGVSFQSALESLVLIKNEGVLPLDKSAQRIAVIGPHATNPRIMYGGYTHLSMEEGLAAAISTMAGLQTEKGAAVSEIETIPGTPIQKDSDAFDEILRKHDPEALDLLTALRSELPNAEVTYSYGFDHSGTDTSHFDEALEAARKADIVIVTVGGKHGTSSIASMGEGIDATNIGLSPAQEEFLSLLGAVEAPVVAVHVGGRAISSDAADLHANAILEAWSPSREGAAVIAGALSGRFTPGGKLPVSVAYDAGQIPVYYNHPNGSSYHQGESIAFADYVDMPHRPRYPFGHGLSYTTFEYSALRLSTKELGPDQALTVSVSVQNSGSIAGSEVVQMYVRDRFASMTRPVMELAGFKRVSLEPSEETEIIFEVQASQLAFVTGDLRWKIEAGDFDVMVGSSSEDIRLTDEFRVTADAFIDGAKRGFYASASVR